jgi:molecular chaperone HscA
MLRDSFASADQDMKLRALREEQVEAERILLATQSALDADANLLSDAERIEVLALLDVVRQKTQGDDHGSVKAAVDALAKGTEEFAARRMDRSVRTALAGKKLDELT